MTQSLSEQLSDIREELDIPEEQPEVEQTTEDAAEMPADELPEQEQQTDEQPEQGDEAQEYTVASLADAIGVEPEFLYSVKVGLGIDGEDPVPLGELKDRYKNAVLESRELKSRLAQQQAVATPQPQPVAPLVYQQRQQQLEQAYNAVNWEELRQNNPQEYAATMADFQKARQDLQAEFQQAVQQEQMQIQQAQQQRMAAMQQALTSAHPEWRDPDRWQQDYTAMDSVIRDYGLSMDEVMAIADPRAINLINDLAQFKSKHRRSKQLMKDRKPRRLKTGAARGTNPVDADKLAQRARQSNDRRDVLAAARAIFNGAKQ